MKNREESMSKMLYYFFGEYSWCSVYILLKDNYLKEKKMID